MALETLPTPPKRKHTGFRCSSPPLEKCNDLPPFFATAIGTYGKVRTCMMHLGMRLDLSTCPTTDINCTGLAYSILTLNVPLQADTQSSRGRKHPVAHVAVCLARTAGEVTLMEDNANKRRHYRTSMRYMYEYNVPTATNGSSQSRCKKAASRIIQQTNQSLT